MDEFGLPKEEEPPSEPPSKEETAIRPVVTALSPDEGIPIHLPPSPSPVPFAHYAPTSVKTMEANSIVSLQEIQRIQEEEKQAGCCRCVVM